MRAVRRLSDVWWGSGLIAQPLLDAVQPEDHEGIVAVQREERSHSRLIPLTEHENYLELVQAGQLGQAVTRGVLTAPPARPQPGSLQELLA